MWGWHRFGSSAPCHDVFRLHTAADHTQHALLRPLYPLDRVCKFTSHYLVNNKCHPLIFGLLVACCLNTHFENVHPTIRVDNDVEATRWSNMRPVQGLQGSDRDDRAMAGRYRGTTSSFCDTDRGRVSFELLISLVLRTISDNNQTSV